MTSSQMLHQLWDINKPGAIPLPKGILPLNKEGSPLQSEGHQGCFIPAASLSGQEVKVTEKKATPEETGPHPTVGRGDLAHWFPAQARL